MRLAVEKRSESLGAGPTAGPKGYDERNAGPGLAKNLRLAVGKRSEGFGGPNGRPEGVR